MNVFPKPKPPMPFPKIDPVGLYEEAVDLGVPHLPTLPPKYTRLITRGLDVTIPPMYYTYQWEHDPVQNRHWMWDTFLAQSIQAMVAYTSPEQFERFIQDIPTDVLIDAQGQRKGVNMEYAAALTPEQYEWPLIGVTLPEPCNINGQPVGVVIDGNHRLWKRWQLGLPTTRMFMMPPDMAEGMRLKYTEAEIALLDEMGLL